MGKGIAAWAQPLNPRQHHPDRLDSRLVTNASNGTSAGEQESCPLEPRSAQASAATIAASPAMIAVRRRSWIMPSIVRTMPILTE